MDARTQNPSIARGGDWCVSLEFQPQSELQTTWLAAREDVPEEWTEIDVLARDAPVRVIQDVESFGAELNGGPFMNRETTMQRQVHDVDARCRQNVAAGIAERVRFRI